MTEWLHHGVAALLVERIRSKASPPLRRPVPLPKAAPPPPPPRPQWSRYTAVLNSDGPYWWHCDPMGYWFWEEDPGPFRRYVDVNVFPWRFWWCSEVNPDLWFFEDSGNKE